MRTANITFPIRDFDGDVGWWVGASKWLYIHPLSISNHFLQSGVSYSVVTNASFIGRVETGVQTSVYIAEFAVIIILARED